MNATWRSEPSSEAARRAVVQIEPDWFGKLSGITLLFEALVLARYPACSFCEAGSTDTPSYEITSKTVPPQVQVHEVDLHTEECIVGRSCDSHALSRRAREIELHVKGVLDNGVTVEEIRAVLVRAAAYCGIPAGLDAFRAAHQVLISEGAQSKP